MPELAFEMNSCRGNPERDCLCGDWRAEMSISTLTLIEWTSNVWKPQLVLLLACRRCQEENVTTEHNRWNALIEHRQ